MKVLNKYKYNILAFFIPIIIVSLCLITYKCFFGMEKSLLIGDLKAQYISLFSYFRDLLLGEKSFFYSFSKGLGGNMIGTFSYYLSSPLNLLVLLFTKQNLEAFIILLLLIKTGLSGFTMNLFLSSKVPEDKKIIPFILSVCYALNSYVINYYFNIMWLDSLYLLPLVLLGIDKILEGKKGFLYLISLFLVILCNYYIGYMVCIFSVIYFAYKLFIQYSIKKDKIIMLKKIGNFILLSLISVLITSVFLIPTVLDLQNTVRSFGSLTANLFNDVSTLFTITSRLFVGSNATTNLLSFDNINIYCGLLIIPLVYFYFINKNVHKKEKIASAVVILIFICSICCTQMNYIWHGFNFPQGFPNRFSFMFIAFLIILANQSLLKKQDKFDNKHYLILIIFYLINALFTVIYKQDITPLINIYISCVLFMVYIIIIYIFNQNKYASYKDKLFVLLALICCAEMFANASLSYYKTFVELKVEYKDFVNQITEIAEKYDSSDNFYRIDGDFKYSFLDSFIGNYKSASSFLSTNNKFALEFANTSGILAGSNSYELTGTNTPVLNNLLGIKYIITNKTTSKNYIDVDDFQYSGFNGYLYGLSNTTNYVYKNKDALSIGYMVSEDILQIDDKVIDGGFYSQLYYQDLIVKTMTNTTDNIFDLVQYSVKNSDYIIEDADGEYYVEYRKNAYAGCETYFYLNDMLYGADSDYGNNVAFVYPDEKGKIKVTFKGDIDINLLDYNNIFFYKLNQNNLDKAMVKLKEQQLNIEEYSDGYLKGNIDVKEDNILFTSIPYEEGWTILVDGQKTDYYTMLNGFIGFDLDKGYHTIEMKFFPPGLKAGAIISIISILISVIYAFYDKLKIICCKLKKV